MKIVINNECVRDTLIRLFDFAEEVPNLAYNWQIQICNVDNTAFIPQRNAQKIMNDYAVTQLPFVLLCDEEDKAYSAVYSEEGPITIERINQKS